MKKKLLFLALFVLLGMLPALGVSAAEPEKYEMGDVSMDGCVDVYDAILIKQHLVDMIMLAEEQQYYADVYYQDGSGVDVFDVVMLLQHLVGMDVELDTRATITFETNGGSAVPSITEKRGADIAAPADPEKTDYIFLGWYTDVACTEAYTFSTMPEEDLTLYAKWSLNRYTISFNTNGGSAVSPITQNYNTTVTKPANPVKTGYTFGGWYTDDACTTPFVFETMPAGNITLYAKWIENPLRLVANATGMTLVSYTGTAESLVLPNDITQIGEGAFRDCAKITSVEIPIGLTVIGNYAFENCANLTSIVFTGTKSQWALIEKGESWNPPFGGYTVYCSDGIAQYALKDFLIAEVEDTVSKAASEEPSFVFALVTDVHISHSPNYHNWGDTLSAIANVHSLYPLNAIFSLGDAIEGNREATESEAMLEAMRDDLLNVLPESYMLTGNHDTNDYVGWPTPTYEERLSVADRYDIYGSYADAKIVRNGVSNYGYYDVDALNIRVIILDVLDDDEAYGTNMYHVGYSMEQVAWVRDVALDTDHQVLFLSHTSVSKEFNYRGVLPMNGVELRNVIESFIANDGTVIGLFHGHTHWDNLGKYSEENGFYEISTGTANSSKMGETTMPTGASVPERTKNTVTQELWDLVVITPSTRTVKIIRFGAGEDRKFTY